jgi:hypothetical protein
MIDLNWMKSSLFQGIFLNFLFKIIYFSFFNYYLKLTRVDIII